MLVRRDLVLALAGARYGEHRRRSILIGSGVGLRRCVVLWLDSGVGTVVDIGTSRWLMVLRQVLYLSFLLGAVSGLYEVRAELAA